MNYYLTVLKKYAVFKGRATRAEYWYFSLFNIIIAVLISIISSIIKNNLNLLLILYILLTLIPSIAVSIRRLHDIGKSGWMILISWIPLVGTIWIFVLMMTDSNAGENKYGPNPKELKAE